MIRCSKCGYVGVYLGELCPDCKEKFILTTEEIEDKIAEISHAEQTRQ